MNALRVWSNGRTTAFQAVSVGSIPITRFVSRDSLNLGSRLTYAPVAQLDSAGSFYLPGFRFES